MPHNHHSRAALFVDLDSIRDALDEDLSSSDLLDAAQELIDAVRSRLRERNTQVVEARAYAEFDILVDDGAGLQRALWAFGLEPRYVPQSLDVSAVEVQLAVDACVLIHARPDVDTIVIVTGTRTYLPLVQHAVAAGRRIFVAPTERLSDITTPGMLLDHVLYAGKAENKGSGRRALAVGNMVPAVRVTESADRDQVTYSRVTDDLCLRAIDVIDRHFGQYEEIYLTPLLRKLSEELEEANCDPKVLVSMLEEAGLVWLEKRQGYPYDYTVLLIDENHPDAPPSRFREEEDEEELYYNDEPEHGDAYTEV